MLTIVISTWEEGILNLEKTVRIKHPDVCYIIVHQTQQNPFKPSHLANRRDVEVISSSTKGLSRSRNIGLKHCKTKYALLADDDVEYSEEGINQLLHSITIHRPDFALFKIQTNPGEPEYKVYPTESYQVKELQHWVSSIEIAVNVTKLKKLQIAFDERFGLGTSLNRGEEEIFIHDLITNGLTGIYFPFYLVKHPYMSSGKEERTTEEQWFVQGALDQRMNKIVSREIIQEKLSFKEEMAEIAELSYHKGRALLQD